MTPILPTPTQVHDCTLQLAAGKPTSYPELVQGYAQLRLADFSAMLVEWTLPHDAAHSQPLPQVAEAIKQPDLSPEQSAKLLAWLQQQTQQGQRTAALYWAYLLAKGLFTEQQPQKAAKIAQYFAQQGDWRASRLLGEMLAAAPLAAPVLLQQELQAACTEWQKTHPQHSNEQVQAACERFCQAPIAIKHRAKQYLEQAIAQGSPTAPQRLRGLTALGLLSAQNAPKRHQSIADFLELQLNASQPIHDVNDDPDILVLPDHIYLLVADDDERPTWYKPAMYGAFALFALIVFTVFAKLFFIR
ncbi:hypothetical protein QG059_01805 [Kingella kingae]|uniref:hypothetical protein n=1 Tax=Kingella kingae TaxID=504 RepID=UPI002554AA5D|nr:hypothetical protein [Kingella kingae]MDK4639756.1 hypothetical protein [Kingella kingae]